MELSKKTTILFPPDLHTRLAELASRRNVSMGELVREACERAYGQAALELRREALRRITSLEAPVEAPEEMGRQSVPSAEAICPDPV